MKDSFSLVIRAVAPGSLHPLHETLGSIFVDEWCYPLTWALTWHADECLPCEIAAGLTQEDAETKAKRLRQVGAQVEVARYGHVPRVKLRAAECWPTHRASNGESFSERHGVIVGGAGLTVKRAVKGYAADDLWSFERFHNHQHPSHDFNREALRLTRDAANDFRSALGQCFPDRAFLVIVGDGMVTFCRATDALPRGIVSDGPGYPVLVGGAPEPTLRHCERCDEWVRFVPRAAPDSEFPHATFGDCPNCGGEILVHVPDEYIDVGPQTGEAPVAREP